MMISFYKIPLLRKFILPLLQRLNFDFEMSHPWVNGKKIKLHSFKHKGYWYHRKKREYSTMLLFSSLIKPGFTVVEAGGHIGFVSLYFASLVGTGGRVFVFEPGSNNLPYIKHNLKRSFDEMNSDRLVLIEAAVGEQNGVVSFFEDSLTGQNNSVIADFQGLRGSQECSYVESSVQRREVRLVSLDSYFADQHIDFIKIDIEGYEWFALQGASEVINRNKPSLMVEVQSNQKEIFAWLTEKDYILVNDVCKRLKSPSSLKGNIFCLHKNRHAEIIGKMNILN
jgi:FkbM family methyltransferase